MNFKKLKVEELNRPSVERYRQIPKIPLIIILDNIRSLHNVGSVFRTADAFLIESVFLVGLTAKPPHREIQKTALGATESVDWQYFETPVEAIENLLQLNYDLVVIEQTTGSIPLESFDSTTLKKGFAAVFGNEVNGVSQPFIDAASQALEIPQSGTKHSLNVSVTAGIVMYELNKLLS